MTTDAAEGRSADGRAPRFRTLATRDIPRPHYLDLLAIPLPARAPADPELWARELFSVRSMPVWVVAALGVRQLLAPLIGVPQAPRDVFAVTDRSGEEALIAVDDRHLDFRCAVGVDEAARLVRVTTAVRMKGWRGRLYFGVVRLAHPLVVDAMLRKTARRLAGTAPERRRAREGR